MNTLTWTKKIHKTMRDAGYTKRRSTFEVGSKIYSSHVNMLSGRMTVYIPGNWSIHLRNQFRAELMSVLKDFNPKEDKAYSGVDVYNS